MKGQNSYSGPQRNNPRPARKRNTGALTTLDFNSIQEHLKKLMEAKKK